MSLSSWVSRRFRRQERDTIVGQPKGSVRHRKKILFRILFKKLWPISILPLAYHIMLASTPYEDLTFQSLNSIARATTPVGGFSDSSLFSIPLIHKRANMTILSRQDRPLKTNAIVLLVQKKHSTYQRDSYGLLLQALDLLYHNYLSQHPSHLETLDIFLFHTGDFDAHDLEQIEPRLIGATGTNQKGMVKLVNLKDSPYWQLPHNLKQDDPSEWLDAHIFPVGYRHMCRFFAVKIWDFFETLNTQHYHSGGDKYRYRYIWRLDEDSLIHSPITYNVFDFMKQHQYAYGYRLCSYELTQNKFIPQWFDKWHAKVQPIRQPKIDWELCGFYNNLFVADLEFFRRKKVHAFLNELDQRGFVYRKRYGDLVVHSLAVYAFAHPREIHRFLDFSYEHVTIDRRVGNKDGCVIWGAIQAGYLDHVPNIAMDNFHKKFIVNRNCTANVTHLTYPDLSPTYSHLSDEWQQKISLPTIAAGKVEMLNKGLLSG